jgi:hypothetical protein
MTTVIGEYIRNGEKSEPLLFPKSSWREEEQICNRISETFLDPRIWWKIREEDSGAKINRRSESATVRRRRSASQEMRRKKTQNPRESIPIDLKQTNIGIGKRGAI